MKRSLIAAISIISAIGLASPAIAESTIATNSPTTRQIFEISPFNLVKASYQGRFINQGIPSAGRFRTSVRHNRIKAQDLVKVAISQRRLSAETLEDKSYIRNVQSILDGLDRN